MHRSLRVLAVALLAVVTGAGCGGVRNLSTAGAATGEGTLTLAASGASTDPTVPGSATGTATGTGNVTPGGAAGNTAAGTAGTATVAPTTPGGGQLPLGVTLDQARAIGLGTDGFPVVAVVRTAAACRATTRTVPAGKVWFTFANRTRATSTLVLRTATGTGLIGLDEIAPGAGGAFPYLLAKGSYLLTCAAEDGTRQRVAPLSVTDPTTPPRK